VSAAAIDPFAKGRSHLVEIEEISVIFKVPPIGGDIASVEERPLLQRKEPLLPLLSYPQIPTMHQGDYAPTPPCYAYGI